MDKLRKANQLKREIDQLEEFMELVKRGNVMSRYDKENEYREVMVSADIWTGTQAPNYKKSITTREDIAYILKDVPARLEDLILKKKAEFDSLWK